MRSKRAYRGGVDQVFMWTIVAVIPVLVLGGALVVSKGGARRRNRASEIWLETEVEYKARNDLIPKLEDTLKGYAFHPNEASREVTAVLAGALSVAVSGGANTVEQSRGDLRERAHHDLLGA
jgi:hypothetical protein